MLEANRNLINYGNMLNFQNSWTECDCVCVADIVEIDKIEIFAVMVDSCSFVRLFVVGWENGEQMLPPSFNFIFAQCVYIY